ncbi:hypothetical protein VTK26DRAFT_2131 [Humicola hyalothermophila]
MKPTALLTTLLNTALAATLPDPAPRHLRLLHTLPSSVRSTRILSTSSSSSSSSDSTESTESTRGGAVLTLPYSSSSSSSSSSSPQKQKITTLHGTFRLPHADPPTSGPTANNPVGVYAASFWLGLDSGASSSSGGGLFGSGSGCGGASAAALRAGVDIFHDGTLGGEQTPFAWYQFGGPPAPQGAATGFADFAVAPGDLVRITVENGGGGGEVAVVVENFGRGNGTTGSAAGSDCVTEGMAPLRTARKAFPVVEGGGGEGLCGTEAAWVVEDFPLEEGLPDVPVALANFTSVTFAQAGVELADGSRRDVGGEGVEVMDVRLDEQGGRLTKCEIAGEGKKVTCKRVVGDE